MPANTTYFDEYTALELKLNDIAGTVSALEIVTEEFDGIPTRDLETRRLRGTISALTKSLALQVKEAQDV
ncbi:hypothetical protein [Thalassobius sp. I31.1]|uniref:hypothetical protein n=1 Tax=Thalassobius sp. I31.1 TaxID=2109912 RepID=UPI000D1A79F2|nr:hypothetical protein [Thalassobius sp. I31.1]